MKIVAGRGLPVMDRSTESTDAFVEVQDSCTVAHQIRVSDILPWDRKSYLTHAILPRLSREGYIPWLY